MKGRRTHCYLVVDSGATVVASKVPSIAKRGSCAYIDCYLRSLKQTCTDKCLEPVPSD